MIFEEQVSRKPNHYPWTEEFMEAAWSGFWTPSEFNFRSDYSQFISDLTEEEKGVIIRTLSAIGQIEIAVKSFWANLGENLPHPALKDLGYTLSFQEVIHNKAYERLIEHLGLEAIFEQNLKEDVVKGRVEYLKKYLKKVYKDHPKQYVYSIILFTLFVENVSLFSQFYIILHFNRNRAILKDTAQQVQYTRLEEQLHSQVGIKIINTIRKEHPEIFDEELETRIRHEVEESIKAESNVIDWILGGYEVDGLNADILKNFIRKRMKDSMKDIGFNIEMEVDEALYDKAYWFDEALLGSTMTDFFQKRPVEYSRGKGVALDQLF